MNWRTSLFLIALCTLLCASAGTTTTASTTTGSVRENDKLAAVRKARCGTTKDCVHVKTAKAQLLVDELDFNVDTPETVLARLPHWFGPQRPHALLLNGKLLNAAGTLSSQGVEVGSVVNLVAAAAAEDGRDGL
ncbi:hypothetical protein DQ04_02231050 [Trypanosoma grayi]|uniref:hypothetical protein n=1 Tax=Trypanosoma grayi TaxID=71804 RepID=UPI0004F4BA34|nr:hypothetical protein DQ04_02231050 [Trypanosoma grayi]KEG11836.1 hypothetical protein DQ04_02231050 [Trypanosoma grayi]